LAPGEDRIPAECVLAVLDSELVEVGM